MVSRLATPNTDKLADKVEFFYQYSNRSGTSQHYTYPNNHCFWTIALNSRKTFGKTIATIEEDSQAGIVQNFVGPISRRIKVKFSGRVDLISVCFKPLHIHSFLNYLLPLGEEIFIHDTPREIRIPDSVVLTELNNPNEDHFTFLEQYLLGRLNHFHKPKIERAIKMLEGTPEARIEDIALELDLSVKSLIANFKKYVGRTPLEYRRVHKFRSALASEESRLSSLSYQTNYFDQSHMIREFHKFARQTPGQLKKRKNISGDKDIVWYEV